MAGTDYEDLFESWLEDQENDHDSAMNVTDSNVQIGYYNQQIIGGSVVSCLEHSSTESCLHCSHENLLESVDDIKNELKNKRSSCNDDQFNLRKVLERVNSLSRGIKHLHHQMENFTTEVANCRKDIDDIQRNLKGGSNCNSEIIKKVESVNKAMGRLEDKCVREYEHAFKESSKQDKKKGFIKRMGNKVKKAFTNKSRKYNFRSASTVDCSRISLLDAASDDKFGSCELTTEHDITVDSGFCSMPYHSMDCLSSRQCVQQTVQYETTV